MQVKRFLAPNLPQALGLVKEEYGEEAVILHTKKVRQGGIFGWLRPEVYEVIAAQEEQKPVAPPRPQPAPQLQPAPPAEPGKPLEELEREYQKLGRLVAELKTKLPAELPFTGRSLEAYQALLGQGFDEALAKDLLAGQDAPDGELWPELARQLEARLKISPLPLPKSSPIVLALIGPTGVGKTTTLAKLAALYSIKRGYKVGLVTIDTYRIGAVEQLRTYAEILAVPLEVALTTDQLKAALERLRESCQVIFLDTAGRSQQNGMQLRELKAFLQAAAPDETFLVLSGTQNLSGARQVLANFAQLGAGSLIISKLDEVASFGPVASILSEGKLPLCCLTCGQAVPEDLQLAAADQVADLCLRGARP